MEQVAGQVVASNADGRLEVFAAGDDGNMWHMWQISSFFGQVIGWSDWASLGAPFDVGFSSPPAVVLNGDGRLELFAAGSDGHVAHIWQAVPNGGWSNWWVHKEGGAPNGVQGAPAVARHTDGRLEIFVVERDTHQLYSQPQVAPNDWGQATWYWFGAPPGVRLASSPAIGRNENGWLEVFVVGSDGQLWKKVQALPRDQWTDWLLHGAPPGVRWTSSPVVASNADGRLELFMVGTDGQLWHEWQVELNGRWSHWRAFGSPGRPIVGTPAIGSNSLFGPLSLPGRLELFVVTDIGDWLHRWQVVPDGDWSGWNHLPYVLPVAHGALAVGSNADGRLEVFGSGGDLVHTWQDPSSDTSWWEGPVDDGGPFGGGLRVGNPPDNLGSPPNGVRLFGWDWPVLYV